MDYKSVTTDDLHRLEKKLSHDLEVLKKLKEEKKDILLSMRKSLQLSEDLFGLKIINCKRRFRDNSEILHLKLAIKELAFDCELVLNQDELVSFNVALQSRMLQSEITRFLNKFRREENIHGFFINFKVYAQLSYKRFIIIKELESRNLAKADSVEDEYISLKMYHKKKMYLKIDWNIQWAEDICEVKEAIEFHTKDKVLQSDLRPLFEKYHTLRNDEQNAKYDVWRSIIDFLRDYIERSS